MAEREWRPPWLMEQFFRLAPWGFPIKPITRERLEKAIRRAQEELAEEHGLSARFAPLLEGLAAQGHYLTRLAVHHRNHIRVLNVDEVGWKGSHILRLTTGAEVELSRAQARALRKILGW